MAISAVSALGTLRAFGTPGRRLAVRADLVRSTGVRHAARRLSDAERREHLDRGRRVLYKRLWGEAADRLGAELVDLGSGFLEARVNGSRARVWESWTALDDAVTLRLALDKALVSRLLSDAGLPVPEQLELPHTAVADAASFLERGSAPCVVKPARGTAGGHGVTSGVRTRDQLRRALLNASLADTQVLVERQVEGGVYRLLFLDGELIDVVRRGWPTVTGDGRRSVGELISAENARRLERSEEFSLDLLSVDLDTIFALRHARLRLRSVIPAGETVAIKRVTNESRCEDNETVRAGVSDELVAEAQEAVRLVGLRLAGVDVITADPGLPLRETGGVVIEVNGTPGLHHHYQVADRAGATRVAVPVLERLLARASG